MQARKDGLIFKPEGFDLEAPKIGWIIQSLRSSEHLIILALRLIVVALNLFQVPDVISPNTWHHKASKSAFLGQSWSQWFLIHYISFAFFLLVPPHTLHIIARCALYGQGTFCSELQGEDKAVIERVYFWALNGLVPILYRSRSHWHIPFVSFSS